VALAGAMVLLTGCGKPQAQHTPPPPTVTVVPAEKQEIVEWAEFTGRIEPVEAVEVRPRVSGFIQEVKFQSGQIVKKGEVLFVIDARWHQATFDQRQAELAQAQALLDNARREAERTGQLLEKKAISVEEADTRQSRFRSAEAALLAAQAALDSARLDLEHTQVRAPIDGRVSRALLTEGNYVNGVAAGATLLTTIVSVDPVYVYADIDENSLLNFNQLARAGKVEKDSNGRVPVQLQLADEAGFPHRGSIESFDNRLNAETGSILLRATFPNTDGRIVPGLFARIRIPASARHGAVLVEETAIGTDQAQKFVLTLTSSNTVAYRPVKLGPSFKGKRLVREGLQQGEPVVQNVVMARVRPGMPVQPQAAVAATTNAGVNIQTAQTGERTSKRSL
jgi:RND family efflux transporter MFP subunit